MVMVPSTDGVSLAVHDLGGIGPPLLMIHATGFHGRVWQPCASHLRDFHCLAPDMRGHGDSSLPESMTFHWSGFADDVLAVIDAHDLDRVRAVGHSKGGAALLLAEQRRPGTFRTLYLYEPIALPTTTEPLLANPLADSARRRRSVFDSLDAAYENFAAKPPLDALSPDALRAYVDGGFTVEPDGRARLKCRPDVESQVYRMAALNGAFGHLDEVRCPATVAVGVEAPGTPAFFGETIAAALPHGRLERHPDLGHFGPLEDPAAIAEAIRVASRQ
jgi:pimeloyl-ACP methyl ester carboxylesterase